MRKNTAEPISDVLKNVLEKLGQSKKKGAFDVLSAWPSVVGKGLSRHSRPAGLKKGTLVVLVQDSAWFYQATLQKEKLLKALQKKLGADKVQAIRFRVGNIKKVT